MKKPIAPIQYPKSQNAIGLSSSDNDGETRVATKEKVVGTYPIGVQSPETSELIDTTCGCPVNFSNESANALSMSAMDTAASDDSIPMSYDSFKNLICFLAVIFNREPNKLLVDCYWTVLRQCDAAHLRAKAYQIAKTGSSFPLPKDFLEEAASPHVEAISPGESNLTADQKK